MPNESEELDLLPTSEISSSARKITTAVVVSEPPEDDTTRLLPYPVVAIGASAGGLEAYIELLAGLPADTGMAYVFIPHLAPEHKSHLVEILQRHTSMPVVEIAEDAECRPNYIYVLPPNTRATIHGGRLRLEPRPEGDRIPKPIDYFFRSLAGDQKNRAIGVILSGSDGDGALGLRAIKGEGGIAIVQSPDTARFPDMPRSGIAADHVDLVLPPAQMGKELVRLARQFGTPGLRPLEDGKPLPDEEQYFAKIIDLLRGVSGLDFRHYKEATIRRRMARRLMLRRIDSLQDYLRFVRERPDELRDLQEDLLINVTRFFRDPHVFESLKEEIFPKFVRDRNSEQSVRIWSAGCSTGEEVYSLAIVLLEWMAEHSVHAPVQIFGTDASEESIQKARGGSYPESLVADISPERLRRYFQKIDGGYRVTKRVRDLCVFARQNLCNDPPFSRIDLVSCRNVLIYLTPEIQNLIVGTFHYALKPQGFLLLGASESLRNHGDLFSPTDRKHRFYLKESSSSALPSHLLLGNPLQTPSLPEVAQRGGLSPTEEWSQMELQRTTDLLVLSLHGPPGVVVNRKLEVLQIRGQVSPYLRVPSGTPTFQLLRMTHEAIAPTLRDALQRVFKSELPLRVSLGRIFDDNQRLEITAEIMPVQSVRGPRGCCLVLFFASSALALSNGAKQLTDESTDAGLPDENTREIVRLRQDLASTRLYSQSLDDERDARNHELVNAYEELQSSNEELQSSNEELQTAKEELQSTNEELQTVNEEMRDRNASLLQASNDLANLFNSVNIPLVMLGMDLEIRHFTPPAERSMNLRSADIGRSISEVRLNLKLEEIEPLLREVLETLVTKEVEVQDRSEKWHLLRIRPYRTTENKIEGLVLVLVDIDQLRRDEEAMRESRDFAQTVLECAPIPLVVLREDFQIRKVNAAFCALSNLSADELERRSFPELVALLWNVEQARLRLEDLKQQPHMTHRFEHQAGDGRIFCFNMQRVVDGSLLLLVAMEDITARKEFEKQLRQEKDRLIGEVESTARELGSTREELRSLAAGLFESQEEERRRVARELHDDVSQKLALLEIQAREFRKGLPEELGDVKEHLQAWSGRLGKLSEDVRLLSHGLHPSILDDLGLTPALRQMINEFGEREGMPTTFEAVAVSEELSRDAKVALYRIAQEALRNVAKHAGKTHVRMTLMGIEDGCRLTIRDLGHGFDKGEHARSGLGLLSMEERTRLVGGTIRVESEVNAGTSVEVEVPVT